jgi:hypothetical protein
MDPLSALGLAAAVVQFASFTLKIITTLVSASNSASEVPPELADLDDVYSKLRAQSQRLETAHCTASRSIELEINKTSSGRGFSAAHPVWDDQPSFFEKFSEFGDDSSSKSPALLPTLLESYQNLSALLVSCNAECSKLMDIVGRFKAHQKPGSLWSSARAVATLMLKKGEIDRIEERIRKCNGAVLAELCNLSA